MKKKNKARIYEKAFEINTRHFMNTVTPLTGKKTNKQTKYNKARTEKVSKVSLWLKSKGQLVKEQKQIKTKKGLLQGIYLSDSSSVSSLESTSFLLRE